MVFYSYAFVFLFLPVFLIGYYLMLHLGGAKKPAFWILACSLIFCLYYNVYSLLVLLADCAVSYGFLKKIAEFETISDPETAASAVIPKDARSSADSINGSRKAFFVLGICCHIAVLGFFKYFNFFASGIAFLFGKDWAVLNILLPLGISYITFQQIALLSDVYHKRTGVPSILNYLLYIFYFPKMMAGPVTLYHEMGAQFDTLPQRRPSKEQAMHGGVRFILGLSKASLLAGMLGTIADYAFDGISSLTFLEALIAMAVYMLQLYFDFSGYCDMGQGISRMIGLELPENFLNPFHYRSFIGTWKNWHATLTRFLTKYLYIPLGGSRKGAFIQCRNILIVFLISGLWHGADMSFVVWGAMNGVIYLAAKLLYDRKKTAMKTPSRFTDAFERIGNFLLFAFTFVLFRADSLSDGFAFYSRLFTGLFAGNRFTLQRYYGECFEVQEIWYVMKALHLTNFSGIHYCMAAIVVLLCGYLALFHRNAKEISEHFKFSLIGTLMLAFLFAWSILSFAGVDTFIYLKF